MPVRAACGPAPPRSRLQACVPMASNRASAHRARSWALGASVLALALLAGGCSDDESSPPPGQEPSAQGVAPAPGADDRPARAGSARQRPADPRDGRRGDRPNGGEGHGSDPSSGEGTSDRQADADKGASTEQPEQTVAPDGSGGPPPGEASSGLSPTGRPIDGDPPPAPPSDVSPTGEPTGG